jgi:rSAM/selenodomain-associated transferase 2
MPPGSSTKKISIIIPVLNEAEIINPSLQRLQPLRSLGHELIVVDGGSADETIALAAPLSDRVLQSDRGRALQMNAGAKASSGEVLWFLHADTHIQDDSHRLLCDVLSSGYCWGRFDVRLSGRQWLLRIIERMMNLRSCLTGIATGDQGLFMTRRIFNQVNGFPLIPLMEDIEISKRLNKLSRPACVRQAIITSSRRWEQNGIFRTVLLMWRLRFLYWLGVPAERLRRHYD